MASLRKMISTGMGMALSQDKNLLSALTEIKLTDFLVKNLGKIKEEVVRALVTELRSFFERVDLREEIHKALKDVTLEVDAKIRLVPTKQVSLKHSRQKKVRKK